MVSPCENNARDLCGYNGNRTIGAQSAGGTNWLMAVASRLARWTPWVRLARWPDWSTSKLPYIGAVTLLLASPQTSAVRVLGILGTVLFWAAFGYGINEVADRDCDLRAGKSNRAAHLTTLRLVLFLTLTASAASGLSLLWAPDHAAPVFVVVGLLLAVAYSLPPLRLKERGVFGLLAGSASQWVLPVLAVAAAEPRGWSRPAAWCLAFLGLAIGTRWMAIHQLQDAVADHRAGVRTYASRGGRVWPVLLGAFLTEVVFLVASLKLMWPQSLPAVIGLAFWVVQQAVLRPRGESLRQKLQGYDHAPLAEYYFLLLPFSLALGRGLSSPSYLVLAAGFVALGWCYLEMMSGEWCEVWRARRTSA